MIEIVSRLDWIAIQQFYNIILSKYEDILVLNFIYCLITRVAIGPESYSLTVASIIFAYVVFKYLPHFDHKKQGEDNEDQ